MIEITNLAKTYKKDSFELHVLKELSLNIDPSDSIAILGDSGSGKTTLLSLLGGLEKPSSGKIVIDNNVINEMDQKQLTSFRATALGIVFQQYHLMQYLSALENVMLPLEINNIPDAKQRAKNILNEVGLKDRENHLPAQLSGGECQRVALARALVTNPKILLADEPTGSLDRKTGEIVMDLIFKLKEKYNTTLILVTHNESLAKRCNRILKMVDGQLV